MNKPELSPAFEYDNYEEILEWAKEKYDASVEYCDEFVDGLGNRSRMPELGSYSLSWSYGVIGGLGKDKEKARKAAALFIYFWTRGVEASIASSCAELYAEHVKITYL